MPFPFQPAAQLKTRPKVSIEFAGQMLLQPGEDDTEQIRTCEIGVNRFALNHVLHVLLVVDQPNFPPTVVPLLRGPLTDNFFIRMGPNPGSFQPGNFRVFAPIDPFVRAADTNNSQLDYRWALNIRTPEIGLPGVKRNRGAEPIVKLTTGTLFSPKLTRVGLEPRLERNMSEPIRLFRIAPELAASIDLPEGMKVLLDWHDLGDPVHEVLPREGDHADTIYTISFINDPPPNSPIHEELALYYRVLQRDGNPIPPNERWSLVYGGAIGTDKIPCLPLIINS
jgi:hypothetical protein